MVRVKKPGKKSDESIEDEMEMLRSEVKRLRMLVEMLMDIVVEMNEDFDFEEETQGLLQPNHTFDVNSAM